MKAFEDDENPEGMHDRLEGLSSEHIVHSQVQKKKMMMRVMMRVRVMMVKDGEGEGEEEGEEEEDGEDGKKGHQGCREEGHPVGKYH